MPIFHRKEDEGPWLPSDLAHGPFAGLQGGAVAGLLTAEVERIAVREALGTPIQMTVWFLRPVPLSPLRTRTAVLHQGGRVSVMEASLHEDGDERTLATARVSIARARPLDIVLPSDNKLPPIDPSTLPERRIQAPHGAPWFMDTMEARMGQDGTAWFRMTTPVVEGAGALAMLAGPADWTHGIGRPLMNVAADPNTNLNIHLLRPPRSAWIGISAHARWIPSEGTGIGYGILRDTEGEIGCVSMSVMLMPFPVPRRDS